MGIRVVASSIEYGEVPILHWSRPFSTQKQSKIAKMWLRLHMRKNWGLFFSFVLDSGNRFKTFDLHVKEGWAFSFRRFFPLEGDFQKQRASFHYPRL